MSGHKKIRLLHVIESLTIGGAEKLLCNTISELPEFEHIVVTLFPSNDLFLLPDGIQHISLNAGKKTDLIYKKKVYKKIVRYYKPHIVHAHLYFATLLAKAFTPSAIPLVFTQHFEFSKNATKWYYAFIDKLLSTRRQTCIAVSNVVMQDYLKTTGFNGKTEVIGIYIPDRYFHLQKVPEKGGRLKAVALGNIKPIKNQQYILDAFRLMKDLPVSCDVYGEGDQREKLEQQALDEDIAVHFKGPIADSGKVLAAYDLYIMPSLTEGFPLALFEAMAVGLPPIVSDIPVFHELLGDDGTYVSLQQPAALREAITCFLQYPDKMTAHGNTVKNLAAAKASKTVYLQKIRKLYTSVSAGA